jgi:hypothetical protein
VLVRSSVRDRLTARWFRHFGGKKGPDAVVVDRKMRWLLDHITSALSAVHPRDLLKQAALALTRLHPGRLGRLPHPGVRLAGGQRDWHLSSIAASQILK